MSLKELNRVEVLTAVKERRLKQSKAAQILGISPRQLRRILRRFKSEGPKGVISRKVGSKGNRCLSQEKKAVVAACELANTLRLEAEEEDYLPLFFERG